MLNIMHIFPTFALGGQQRRFSELANGFSARYLGKEGFPRGSGDNYCHHIISLSPEFAAADLLKDYVNFKTHRVPFVKTSLISLRNLKNLNKIITSVKPVLLCTYNWGSIEAVMAWRFMGFNRDKIGHLHFEDGFGPGESSLNPNTKRSIARRYLLNKSQVIVPSVSLRNIALNEWRLPEENIVRIPNGIERARFDLTNRIYDHAGPVLIGTVGAFRPEKNFERLIDLFQRSSSQTHNSLEIVGDGPSMESIQKSVDQSSAKGRIKLPGATTQPENFYREFDIFVMSSDTEQMPISLLEAMMAGLPVVATDVGDTKSIVSEENKEFVVPVGDDGLYLESLERLIDDPVLRETLGRANQKKARDYFDRAEMMKSYQALFKAESHVS